MAKKANSYISVELKWAEARLKEWRRYIDDNPYCDVKDRMAWKELKNGGMLPTIVASIESQQKALRDTMKEYLSLLDIVDKLREKEEAKAEAKGSSNIPHRMQNNGG